MNDGFCQAQQLCRIQPKGFVLKVHGAVFLLVRVLLQPALPGDLDSGVRLSLEKLGELGRAAALARKSRSMPAAALVARAALATGVHGQDLGPA